MLLHISGSEYTCVGMSTLMWVSVTLIAISASITTRGTTGTIGTY